MLAIDADAHVVAAIRSGVAASGFAVPPTDVTTDAVVRSRGVVRRLLAAGAPDCEYLDVGDTQVLVCVTSVTALRAGAPELISDRLYVVEREQPLPRLLAELAAILSGRAVRSLSDRRDAMTGLLDLRARYGSLTARERLVLHQLSLGRSATEVARALGTSVNTVRAQIAAVLRKLDANSQQVAIARSRRFDAVASTETQSGMTTFGMFGDG